ncbi:MAG TPA: 3'-5' exonuclease [Anaeromyxobacteraceae bacterium]|nr:3'-5' exonuclease [Anaeromyxobacteraceae bacterium]
MEQNPSGRGLGRILRFLRRKATGAAAEVRYAHRKTIGPGEWAQPIRTLAYTVVDCEMTGLDLARDEILSIGAVKIRNNRIAMSDRFYQVFKPSEAVSPKEVILIHGLGPDEVSRGMPLVDALDRLLAFIGDSVVVGHCTSIDLGFLNAALAAHGRGALKNPALDTRLLYRWWRRVGSPAVDDGAGAQLDEVAKEMGLPRYPAHHAFYDALTTGLVFLKLLGEFETSGAVQFRALYREAGVY